MGRIRSEAPKTIVDLGCGTGNITQILAETWPQASVLGIDSSEAMLETARGNATDSSGTVEYGLGDIATFAAGEENTFDLVFSNAALHWVPEHKKIFPQLLDRVSPGGVLAVQMPLSWDQPYARELRAILEEHELGSAQLRERMGQRPVERPPWYWKLLADLVDEIDLWATEYQHQLTGPDPIVEWTRGTALRPVLEDLDDADGERFLTIYREAVTPLYRTRNDVTLFPFRRLFLVARKAS